MELGLYLGQRSLKMSLVYSPLPHLIPGNSKETDNGAALPAMIKDKILFQLGIIYKQQGIYLPLNLNVCISTTPLYLVVFPSCVYTGCGGG
jgi:hypothetical protein